MKQKQYRAEIVKRIYSKEEQKNFDVAYEKAKVRLLGTAMAEVLEKNGKQRS